LVYSILPHLILFFLINEMIDDYDSKLQI